MVVSNAFLDGGVGSEGVVYEIGYVWIGSGQINMPQLCDWGAIADNEGVIVVLDGGCFIVKVCCASCVTKLSNGNERVLDLWEYVGPLCC